MGKRIIKGLWWLPNTPERKVPGDLTIEENGRSRLELQGSLSEVNINSPIFNPVIIVGESEFNEKITLYKNYLYSWSGLFFHIGPMTIAIGIVFIGEQFQAETELIFEQVIFATSNLYEWFDPQHYSITDIGNYEGHNIRYAIEPPKKLEINGMKIEFRSDSQQHINRHKCEVNETIRISIENREATHINDWINNIKMISNFMDLGTGSISYITEMNAYIRRFPVIIDVTSLPKKIEIFLPKDDWKINIGRPLSIEMIYTFRDIEQEIPVLLSNWINIYKNYSTLIDILFDVRNNPYMYLETIFINLIQGIESYHRRMDDNKFVPDEQYLSGLYRLFISVIPSDIDPSFRESLVNGKLRFANEYSLKKRLRVILTNMMNKYQISFVSNPRNINQFIKVVCDTRNYLIHRTMELECLAAKGELLYLLCQRLSMIIEIILMEEIGITAEKINNFINKYHRYLVNK